MSVARTSRNFLRVIVDPPEPNIDIVAVHGLNPTNANFHAEKTFTADGQMWLRDFLPKQLSKARILLFGYNSNAAFKTSTAGVKEHAENLLNRLRAKRSDAVDRPLIYICHSLGGIVVKQAMVDAKLDDNYQGIRAATYGIAFFGTPHQGGELARLGEVASAIARAVLRNPNNSFMEALKKDSLFADGLVRDFRHQLEDYHILSFFETKFFKNLGLIVDRKSATLGLPGTREKQIAMDTDHTHFCKFGAIDDDAYEQVAHNIVELAHNAIQTVAQRERLARLATLPADLAPAMGESSTSVIADHLQPQSLTLEQQDCLKSLSFPEMDLRINDVASVADNTFTWLHLHHTYKEWLATPSSLLWIKGKPGAGKSTLMKYAISHIEGGSTPTATFSFNGRGSAIEKSALGFYRSLLHQLLPLAGEQFSALTSLYNERSQTRGEYEKKWVWHERELQGRLSDTLLALAVRPLRIYIDALDESGQKIAMETVDYLQDQVSKASLAGKSLGVCFSCRHYPLLALDDGLEICVERETRLDIAVYVRDRLAKRVLEPEKAQILEKDIIARADGVFLWTVLVIPSVLQLCRRRFRLQDIRDHITKKPQELHELYHAILHGIPDDRRQQSLVLMRWTCFALEPLSLRQIRDIMVLEESPQLTSFTECHKACASVPADADMKARIIDLSGGLVEFKKHDDKEVIQLIHQSVNDYLVEEGIQILDDTAQGHIIGRSHLHLSCLCARYIGMDDVPSKGQPKDANDFSLSIQSFPLIGYATTFWNKHASEAEKHELRQEDLLQACWLLHSSLARRMDQWVSLHKMFRNLRYMREPPVIGMTISHVLARDGLDKMLSVFVAPEDVKIDLQDKKGRTPLSYAAQYGKAEVVKLLLARGADTSLEDNNSRTPLSYAAENGKVEVVKLLLVHGADTSLEDNLGRTPLSYAADNRKVEVVKLLLAHGADTSLEDNLGRTLLSYAAWYGKVEVVKLLLAHGADPSLKDNNGQTPLSYAVADEDMEMIKLLLANNADHQPSDAQAAADLLEQHSHRS